MDKVPTKHLLLQLIMKDHRRIDESSNQRYATSATVMENRRSKISALTIVELQKYTEINSDNAKIHASI